VLILKMPKEKKKHKPAPAMKRAGTKRVKRDSIGLPIGVVSGTFNVRAEVGREPIYDLINSLREGGYEVHCMLIGDGLYSIQYASVNGGYDA